MPVKKIGIVSFLLVTAMAWFTGCGRTVPAPLEMPVLPLPPPQEFEQVQVRSPQDTTPEPIPATALLVHKVKWRGETLYSIALWYTGSGNNWTRLADANPAIEPKRIRIGDSILIPGDLLKTRRSIPPGFSSSYPVKK